MPVDAQLHPPSPVPSLEAAICSVRGFSRSLWMELLRRDQCERWRSGRGAPVETYFDLLPELRADREDMLILICGETELRREAGEFCTPCEYQCRFPDLAEDIAVQFDLDGHFPVGPNTVDLKRAAIDLSAANLPGYEILQEIGRGASGVIYLARHVSIDRLVAVKAIPLLPGDSHGLSRQHREASILSRLQHPHVVQIYDVIETVGMLYLIIEYVNGPTLVEFAAGSPQPPKAAAQLILTLAEAIDVVHEAGVLHRDLKPSNILLTSGGDLKVTDFGLAKLLSSESQLTANNCLLGTPSYMPPEQASASGRDGGREGDVYSLGAILYELLTGRPPFLGVTVLDTLTLIRDRDPIPCRASQPHTPRDLETICLKCLEKSPERRYRTAAGLAADLARFLQGSAIEARHPSWKERTERWCRRKPGIAILAASLTLAIAAGFFGILWQWNQAESARQSESVARHDADERATEIQQQSERLRAALALENQGHVFSELRRWDDAINALDKAIALCPELGSAWEERGQLYADLGLWDRALEDRRRAFAINEPALSAQWWSYATLLTQAGDHDGYRRLCAKMRARFQAYTGLIAADAVRTSCIMPDGATDYLREAALLGADPREIPVPLYLYAQGLVQYRAGQFDKAVARCSESLRIGETWIEYPLNFPVLALAYAKLGDMKNARTYLERAAQSRDRWIQNLYSSGEKNWILHKGVSGEWEISPFAWLEFSLLYNEARIQLEQPKLADDPRLVVLRARAFTAIRRFDEADAAYKRAIALAPDVDRIRMEHLRCEAYRRVQQNDFVRAASVFAAATQLEPDDIRLWDHLAQAHLAAGNIEAYRQVCREMLQRHRNTSDATTADRVVWMCANRANSVSNLEDLLPLANLALTGYPGAIRTKGALLVRIGRYEEALRSFDESSQFNPPHPSDMCFQAIACYHLGQIKPSRQHLDDAARWIAQANRWELPDVARSKPAWANLGWYERLEALRLFDEAQALAAGDPTPR